ncbi:undecaprenyl-diphosphate phosphatase [Sphingomonas aurantiaca]|uniref:undecaprenyl-diphosphate phosphatase n=1 Tax=Sphingomonas aurantiaca TaxID=185949 RepID=UPI002FE109CF
MKDLPSLIAPIVLGIVEGSTEFIPVSSTGHLILTERLIGYEGRQAGISDVVIQVGAILAICWLYRARLWSVVSGLSSDADARRFSRNVLVAFLPRSWSARWRMISSSAFRCTVSNCWSPLSSR